MQMSPRLSASPGREGGIIRVELKVDEEKINRRVEGLREIGSSSRGCSTCFINGRSTS